MAQMRTWLDHHGFRPSAFDFAVLQGEKLRFRLQFSDSSAAAAFAAVFEAVVADGNNATAEHAREMHRNLFQTGPSRGPADRDRAFTLAAKGSPAFGNPA